MPGLSTAYKIVGGQSCRWLAIVFVLAFFVSTIPIVQAEEDSVSALAAKDEDDKESKNIKARKKIADDPKKRKERASKALEAGEEPDPKDLEALKKAKEADRAKGAPDRHTPAGPASIGKPGSRRSTNAAVAQKNDDKEKEKDVQDNKPAPPTGSASVKLPPPPPAKPDNAREKLPIPTSEDAEKKMQERKSFTEFEPGELYHIDYYDQDLLEFVKQMAEKFKINFLIGDKVKSGKITLISPNPVTREEAWQAFLSVLRSKDLALVRVGKFYKIIPVRDAQREPIKTYLEGGRTDATEEVITYMLKLNYVEIKDIEKILKDFKTKEGEIITYEATNTVIITDTAINIRRMTKILEELDVPSGKDAIHVIDIYYASAQEVADTLNQIFGEKSKTSSSSKSKSKRSRRKGKSSKEPEDESQISITNIISDERTNQLIIVAPRTAMPRILDMINKLDVPIPGDGQVHVYYLENANAEELASTLSSLSQGRRSSSSRSKKGGKTASGEAADLFEGDVKITADKATNSLVVVASTKDFNALKKVIAKLDIRRRQVFVEAVIMEINLKKDRSLGVAVNGGATITVDGQTVPIYAGTTLGSLSSISLDPTALSGLAMGVRGPELSGTEGMLGTGSAAIPSFGVIIQALQTDSDANVLSTPHILTTDNEEAEIIVGSNVPFITGQARDSNNRPVLSIQRQDVALTMKIKPQINESDFVRLQVQQEVTELVSISETLGPTTTKRAAKSSVVVKDNQTIVIGGLLRDRKTEDTDKVPLLGDLPIFGRLFRRERKQKEKTNLLIFLTPHIIKDDEDFRRIYKRKIEERAEFMRRFYGEEGEFIDTTDYSQKVGMVESIRKTIKKERNAAYEADQKRKATETVISPENERNVYEIGVKQDGDTPSPVYVPYKENGDDVPPPPKEEAERKPSARDLMKGVFETPSDSGNDEDE